MWKVKGEEELKNGQYSIWGETRHLYMVVADFGQPNLGQSIFVVLWLVLVWIVDGVGCGCWCW